MDPYEPETAELDLTRVLQALGDPVRLHIVRVLATGGERACGTVQLEVGKATRSHHFRVLREAGITRTRVEGTHRFVSLRRDDVESRFPGLLDAVLVPQRAPA
ncbi:ArsR/SmtB family transcription factor [Baekduia soli]|uniref:ArsR/SmtB family transcription factor n=1 Tax=Baekduia soli TaxID=496014 RepID=UPI001E3F2C0D|nr:helix-turn-helix domain-containing protein [Baekduia soli]